MPKQRWLPFECRERLDILWDQFLEEDRWKVIEGYARLVVRALGINLQITKDEAKTNEKDAR